MAGEEKHRRNVAEAYVVSIGPTVGDIEEQTIKDVVLDLARSQ